MKTRPLIGPISASQTTRFTLLVAVGLLLTAAGDTRAASEGTPVQKPLTAEGVRAAAKAGTITFRLSTPEELEAMLGNTNNKIERKEGDMVVQVLEFPGVTATFGKLREFAGPFTLFELQVEGQPVDIGRDRQLVLRTADDLSKLDSFWGLAGVSTAKLDLRDQLKAVQKFTFDSRTVWPAAEKMPAGFDPGRLLEEGKNPGLGVRKLHAAGIDGKGVGIAIIDQPLLKEHEEYKDRLVTYTEVETDGAGPQMHGPCVASIAVGRNCGVAPGASLYYFAVPSWKWLRNEPWAEQLERVVELNRSLTDTPRIRVVSISLGAFSGRPNPARWSEAVKKAEENGILVVTCDPQFLRLATLKRLETGPEPGANDYVRGLFGYPAGALCVPAANRTLASFRGSRCYTYDRTGGLSWTVPYVAGVAALAWQVDPSITPPEMLELLKRTALKTAAGAVINPTAVIEATKARAEKS
ncbi:MAG TPA: S8/S53 family peptidase [Verrucomicrobiae bacterium]